MFPIIRFSNSFAPKAQTNQKKKKIDDFVNHHNLLNVNPKIWGNTIIKSQYVQYYKKSKNKTTQSEKQRLNVTKLDVQIKI